MKVLPTLISALICVCLAVLGSDAQHCSTGHVAGYKAQVRGSYAQGVQGHAYQNQQQYLVVPYAAPVYGGYYSLQDHYAQQQQAELQRQQGDQSKAYLEIIKLLLQNQQQGGGQLPLPLQAAPQVQSQLAHPELVAYISQACLKCHNSSRASGGLNVEALDSLTAIQRYKCAVQVCSGKMPQGGQPAPDRIKKLFCEFAELAQ